MVVVYRKMQNGVEFMKIMDGMHALSVLTGTKNPFIGKDSTLKSCRILYTNNSMIIHSYKDNHVSMPSSEEEFKTALIAVQKVLSQFYAVQEK